MRNDEQFEQSLRNGIKEIASTALWNFPLYCLCRFLLKHSRQGSRVFQTAPHGKQESKFIQMANVQQKLQFLELITKQFPFLAHKLNTTYFLVWRLLRKLPKPTGYFEFMVFGSCFPHGTRHRCHISWPFRTGVDMTPYGSGNLNLPLSRRQREAKKHTKPPQGSQSIKMVNIQKTCVLCMYIKMYIYIYIHVCKYIRIYVRMFVCLYVWSWHMINNTYYLYLHRFCHHYDGLKS